MEIIKQSVKKLSLFIGLLFGLVIIFTLSACVNRYSVSTNLDSENFAEYFSPSQVTIYQSEQDILTDHRYLGSVEGEDCQAKAHHQAPDEITARTQARKKAFQLGAKAIVFTGCALIEKNEADKQCLATLVCYGKAYQVKLPKSE